MIDVYFGDELHNRLTALEAAAELYQGEFREGVLFGLELVKLSLGLADTVLVIPHNMLERGGETWQNSGRFGVRPAGKNSIAEAGASTERR